MRPAAAAGWLCRTPLEAARALASSSRGHARQLAPTLCWVTAAGGFQQLQEAAGPATGLSLGSSNATKRSLAAGRWASCMVELEGARDQYQQHGYASQGPAAAAGWQAPAANAAGGLLAAAPVCRDAPPRASWSCWDVCSYSAGLPGTGQEWHSMVLQQGVSPGHLGACSSSWV